MHDVDSAPDTTSDVRSTANSANPGDAGAEPAVASRPVRFPAANPTVATETQQPLARFYDVQINVTAELGRATLKLSELMSLGVGSVVELGRLVDQPVDLLAQGVRLGRGDVVAVQDQYGIRITELERLNPSGVSE